MKGLLVRIGIDQAFGRWNAPVDPVSGEFVYVPIPEERSERFQAGMARPYGEVIPRLETFCRNHAVELTGGLRFPDSLSPNRQFRERP